MDFKLALENEIKEKIDIVYLDPPYKTDFIYKSIEIMLKKSIINENTKIIIETDDKERVLKEIENLNIKVIDERKYGRAQVIFLKI